MNTAAPPQVDLDDLRLAVGEGTCDRGLRYADEGRVLQSQWNAGAKTVLGTVDGSQGRRYTAVARLRNRAGRWLFAGGQCSCPMGVDCKHVVALLLNGAARPDSPASSWQLTLDAALPADDAVFEPTPLALEFSLHTPRPTRYAAVEPTPKLRARILRPGKRGGWIAGGVSWSKLGSMWHHPADYDAAQLRVLQELYTLFRAAANLPHYYDYRNIKSIDVCDVDSPRLWSLLEQARSDDLTLKVPAPDGEFRLSTAEFTLDVTADADGSLRVRPVIVSDGNEVAPEVFIGERGQGIAWTSSKGDVLVAPLQRPVPAEFQRLAADGAQLRIPPEETARFTAEYWPRLRRVADVTSSDGSFDPPQITGPVLVLNADYAESHVVTLRWQWEYTVGDSSPRCGLKGREGYRDPAAERAVLDRLDAPLEEFSLRGPQGLVSARLSDMDTMRFATELQPMLAGIDGVRVVVTGSPVEYREASDSLVVSVAADQAPGHTDWFDLDVTISVEGRRVPFETVFRALNAGEDHLLLPSGAYIALDKPELQKLRELIEEARGLTDAGEDDPLRITRFHAGLFDELAALGVIARQAASWQRQVKGLRALDSVAPIELPQQVTATLRPYQSDGFAWMATLAEHGLGGILADDMGLGKTVQTLALICHTRSKDEAQPPFLVVAPSSVVSNWVAEAGRFAPGLSTVAVTDTLKRSGADLDEICAGADVVVTTYTLFRLDHDAHAKQAWSGLILDEAQFVKNRQSKGYQCARKLDAPIKIAITGTPMENNLMELWSLLSITAPGLFPDVKAFKEYWAKPIESGDADLLATLRRRVKPLVKRRTKELVAADLPPKQEQVVNVELPPRHRTAYDKQLQRERQKVLDLLDDVERNRFTILKSLTTLRQMALDASLVDPEACGPNAKIDTLVKHLHDVVDGGHRALVFSQFTRYLGKVKQRLAEEGIEYSYLDGRTRDRARRIAEFRDGAAPVFLISLKAGGFGLNLTEADYCFLLDPWWNPATEAQAVDRTHRIGQTRRVMVYRLISAGTIEEKVRELAARKAKLFASVMDDGDAFSAVLSADDIRALIG